MDAPRWSGCTVTMMRNPVSLVAAVALALVGTGAGAQTLSSAPEYASCPRGTLSSYFASGETVASPQALVLIGRISETAASCQPDGSDLVARIDSRVDGERAVSRALARLSASADDLVAKGVAVERIRVVAQAAGSPAPSLTQIDVLFRKAGESRDAVASPPPAPVHVAPSQAI